MTFTEIVDEICERLNLTSTTAQTRVGRLVNMANRKITSSVGLGSTRRTEAQALASVGTQFITFSDVEKVISVIDKSSGVNRYLDEVTVDELDRSPVLEGDTPTKYAIYRVGASTVQIKTNAEAQTAYTLYAPGYVTCDTLSGSMEPAWPESYHDVLVAAVLADEYAKLEKTTLVAREEARYNDRLGDLRIYIAQSPQQAIFPGKLQGSTIHGSISGAIASGGSVSGTTSYTQTGLVTFDRTGMAPGSRAPFAVAAGSEVVANLIAESAGDADTLDGLDSTYFLNAGNLGTGTLPLARLSNITDTQIAAAAAIAWSKLSKSGSSLADLATRSAADLSSGILAAARLGTAATCEGRLTLTSGTPVTTTDVTAATTVYFTPFRGSRIALYDGSSTWTVYAFTEKSIALPAASSQMYDVFIYDNGGTPTLELTSWTNDTTRATALTTQDGVLVKSGATTRRYLGSVRTTTVAGQSEDSVSKRYLFSYYGRVRRPMRRVESTASWNYTTLTWRQANAAAANQVEFVIGVSEDEVHALLLGMASNSAAGNQFAVGIGLDSTSAVATDQHHQAGAAAAAGAVTNMSAEYRGFPGVGRHTLVWLEQSAAAGTTTFYGNNATGVGEKAGLFGSVMA